MNYTSEWYTIEPFADRQILFLEGIMTAAKRKKNEVDMINGPLLPKILIFSATVFLTNLMQLLFNTSDLVVVGRFAGNDALGAVGATGALTTLFVNLFIGFSVGQRCVHPLLRFRRHEGLS